MRPCPRCEAKEADPGEDITIEIIEAVGSFWGHCNVCSYHSREYGLDDSGAARQRALDEWDRRPLEDALREQLEAQTEETESLYRDLDRLRDAFGGGPRDVGLMVDAIVRSQKQVAAWEWYYRNGYEMYCATSGYRVWHMDDDPQDRAGEGDTPAEAVLAAWKARKK